MPTVNEVAIKIIVDGKELDAVLKGTSEDLNKMSQQGHKSSRNLTRSFSDMKLAILGVAGAVTGVVAGLNKSINAASDFQESNNKLLTVFSLVQGKAQDMARTLQESYFMSRRESVELLGATGDLLTGFGVAQETAADLSFQVQTLAADVASFSNAQGGAKAVSEALTRALLGERESLKTYGIAIQEADVQQRLLANGMQDLEGAALRQAKAQATLELAMEQSKNAIGDLERTSDSYANTKRRVSAQVDDLMVALGEGLMPIASEVLGLFQGFIKAAKILVQGWKDLAEAIGLSRDALEKYRNAQGELLQDEIQARLIELNQKLAETQSKINKNIEEGPGLWDSIGIALVGVTRNTDFANNTLLGLKGTEEALMQEIALLEGALRSQSDAVEENTDKIIANKEAKQESAAQEQINFQIFQGAEIKRLEAERKTKEEEIEQDEEQAKKEKEIEVNYHEETQESVAQINRAFGEKSQEISIASGLVNTYLAVTKALTSTIPPFNFIQAAAVLAFGLKQVDAIRSQAFARGGRVDRPTFGLVGEAGPEIIAPEKQFIGVVNKLISDGSIQSNRNGRLERAISDLANRELRAEIDAESLAIVVKTGEKFRDTRTF